MGEAAESISALHRTRGGSTFNLYFGDLAGQSLYAVSVYPERSRLVGGPELDLRILERFLLDNLDLLQDPRNNAGTWFNEADGNTYLDVSSTLPSRQQAIQLARRYNQIGVFDLRTSEVIETGGTGELIPNLPPPAQRLPELRMMTRRRRRRRAANGP